MNKDIFQGTDKRFYEFGYIETNGKQLFIQQ